MTNAKGELVTLGGRQWTILLTAIAVVQAITAVIEHRITPKYDEALRSVRADISENRETNERQDLELKQMRESGFTKADGDKLEERIVKKLDEVVDRVKEVDGRAIDYIREIKADTDADIQDLRDRVNMREGDQ